MIDIHSHIIPGVDDGSESMESTISLVNDAVSQGARAFFATPHSRAFCNYGENVTQRYEQMKAYIQRLFPNVDVYLGCELLCSKEDMEEIKLALHSGVMPTMNNTNYVLVEFYKEVDWETIKFCISALRLMDKIPIVAHVERYASLVGCMDTIDALRDMECLFQLNVYSLESIQPEHSREWARRLILEKKVDFLGTDMHGFRVRMPSITQGMLWLEENCDREYRDAIAWKNAEEKLIKQKTNTCKERLRDYEEL